MLRMGKMSPEPKVRVTFIPRDDIRNVSPNGGQHFLYHIIRLNLERCLALPFFLGNITRVIGLFNVPEKNVRSLIH